MDREEIIEKIEEILYKHYRITDDSECGCYVNGRWLSVSNVIDVINENL